MGNSVGDGGRDFATVLQILFIGDGNFDDDAVDVIFIVVVLSDGENGDIRLR